MTKDEKLKRLTSALLSLILFTKPNKSNAAALANAHSVLKEVDHD